MCQGGENVFPLVVGG